MHLRGRAAWIAIFLALVGASAWAAHHIVFSTFAPWDDEGYFLLILREYARHGGLYSRIEIPYAPLFFEVLAGFHRWLGMPLDNASGRWVALVVWIVAALASSAIVYRATRSALLAAAANLVVFRPLIALANEPFHPSHGIVFLLPFAGYAAVVADSNLPGRRRPALAGALAGAVFCTKMNVGGFLVLAYLGGLLLRLETGRPAEWIRRIALLALAAFPLLLVRSNLSMSWARDFGVLEAASLAAVACIPWFVRASAAERGSAAREGLSFVAGALAVAALALGVALATGSTLPSLWRGLVVEAARVPGVLRVAPNLPPLAFVVPSLGVFLVVIALHRNGRIRSPTAALAIAGIQIAAAVSVLAIDSTCEKLLYVLPYLWLFAVPVSTGDETKSPPRRTSLVFLAIAASLQVYPVAGSQGCFSVLLPLVVAIVGLYDASSALAAILSRSKPIDLLQPIGNGLIVAGMAAMLAFSPFYRTLPGLIEQYKTVCVPLGLPGTESIRIPEREVAVANWLSANLKANGSTFVGMPGIHSQYIWTGEDPPVPFYSHMWMVQTPPDRQRELANAIATRTDLCVVRNDLVMQDWLHGRELGASPVLEAIQRDYRVVAATGDYQFMLRRGREPNLQLSACAAAVPPAALRDDRTQYAFRLSLPAEPGTRATRLAIHDPVPGRDMLGTDPSSPERELRLVDLDGRELQLPIPMDRSEELLVLAPSSLQGAPFERLFVRVYDEHGEVVARLPFVRVFRSG